MGYPSTDGSEVRVVKRIVGAQPYAVFAEAVDVLLGEAPWQERGLGAGG
jgi:hypothetical protein